MRSFIERLTLCGFWNNSPLCKSKINSDGIRSQLGADWFTTNGIRSIHDFVRSYGNSRRRAVEFANPLQRNARNPRNSMRYSRQVYEPSVEEIESAKRELLSRLEPSTQKDFLEAKADDPNYEHPDNIPMAIGKQYAENP